MAAKRKQELPEGEKLARTIAEAVRGTKCAPHDVVLALLSVAAGRAVVEQTHENCAAFEDAAHTSYHSALAILAQRRPKGDALAN